jgi:excisionase family DNA binding protein
MIKASLMKSKTYTTAEAAAMIGVSRQTLYAWMASGQIDSPTTIQLGKRSMRLWSKADIARARKLKGTLRPGPGPSGKK